MRFDRSDETLDWWGERYFTNKTSLKRRLGATGISLPIPNVLTDESGLAEWHADLWAEPPALDAQSTLGDYQSLYGLDRLCAPFVAEAQRRVGVVIKTTTGLTISREAISGGLRAHLESRLTPLLLPALITEANLKGLGVAEASQSDALSRFATSFGGSGARFAFWSKFPVLRRLTASICANGGLAAIEAIERLERDWPRLSHAFSLQSARLDGVSWGNGDPHRKGRSVLKMSFGDRRLLYKPRPMAIDSSYNSFLTWYARYAGPLAPPVASAVNCGGYGYSDFIEHRTTTSVEELSGFYHQLGQLVCIAWALGITDLHHENVIAAANKVYLIDVEAAGYRPLASPANDRSYDNSIAEAFQALLFGTGLIPLRMKGRDGVVDVSAMGALEAQRGLIRRAQVEGYGGMDARMVLRPSQIARMQNAPLVNRPQDGLSMHRTDILSGFAFARDLLVQHEAELWSVAGPLRNFADCEVRWVGRDTQSYADLLQKIAHPSVAGSAVECEMLLSGALCAPVSHAPHLEPLVSAELNCLWQGDVPYFSSTMSSQDLRDASGRIYPDFFRHDGITEIRLRLAGLQTFKNAHLAALDSSIRSTVSLRTGPTYESLPSANGAADGFDLDTVRGIADQILREVVVVNGAIFTSSLIPLQVEEYGAGVAPPDLYDGVPGIGVFIGYLAALTGDAVYADFAGKVRRLVQTVIRERAGQEVCGAFNGVAGLLYADMHLSACLKLVPSEEATRAVARLRRLAARDQHYDIVSGAAGALLVALRVFEWTGNSEILSVAKAAATQSAAKAELRPDGVAWHTLKNYRKRLGGFAHGATGIAYALSEWHRYDPDENWIALVGGAIAFEQTLFDPGVGAWMDMRQGRGAPTCFWCYGAPGIGMAIERMRGTLGDQKCDEIAERALAVTKRFGVVNSQCLCHGNLGNAELFRCLGDLNTARALTQAAVSDFKTRGHWRCGLPDDGRTPGLMCGLAGIGYGLMRQLEPDLPNILLLEGPPSWLRPRAR